MSTGVVELGCMLNKLTGVSQEVSLINLHKINKIISPHNILVTLDNEILHMIDEYLYAGYIITLGK